MKKFDYKINELDKDTFINSLLEQHERKRIKLITSKSIYLFIGLLIAIIGILYIFFIGTNFRKGDEVNLFIIYTSAIYVELIAFFFLKQFKTTNSKLDKLMQEERKIKSHLLLLSLINDKNTHGFLRYFRFYDSFETNTENEIDDTEISKSMLDLVKERAKK